MCRVRKSLFLGYVIGFKGSILLDIDSQELFIHKNVTFHEHILPNETHDPSTTHHWEYFNDLHIKSESNSPNSNILELHASASKPLTPIIIHTAPITDNGQTYIPRLSSRASLRVRHINLHI